MNSPCSCPWVDLGRSEYIHYHYHDQESGVPIVNAARSSVGIQLICKQSDAPLQAPCLVNAHPLDCFRPAEML